MCLAVPGEIIEISGEALARTAVNYAGRATLYQERLAALRGWAGWGPMAPAFSSRRSGAWREIGERLEWLLPPDQLREAQQATPNAF